MKKALVKLSNFSNMAICGIMLAVVAFLAIQSLMYTCFINVNGSTNEQVDYNRDSLVLNILFLLLFLLAVVIFKKVIYKANTFWLALGVCIAVFGVSLVWILSVKSLPGQDSAIVYSFGKQLAGKTELTYNDITKSDYFFAFPYQINFAVVCAVFIKLFGDNAPLALQITNAVLLSLMYAGIILLVNKAFADKRFTNMTSVILLGNVAPMLMTTFVYGLISGFAFAVWAMYFSVCVIKTDKKLIYMLLSAIMIALAYFLKQNNAVVLVAICVVYLIDFLKSLKWQNIAAIMLSVAFALFLSFGVKAFTENKLDTDFGDGAPTVSWLCIGLGESPRAPGWWNRDLNAQSIYGKCGHEAVAATNECKRIIKDRLSVFSNDLSYTGSFFYKKLVSQWNEPTYESIWISQVKDHNGDYSQYVKDIYDLGKGSCLYKYMNIYQQTVFAFAVIGIAVMLFRKDSVATLLPLCVFGGFLYHLLFEAKSQYLITYFTVLTPACAIGCAVLADKITDILKARMPRAVKAKFEKERI